MLSRMVRGALHRARLCRGVSSTAYRSFDPSPEQLAIVKHCATHNVLVSARPGSGKTSTAQAILAAYPNTPTAVITYSKRLQLETAERLAQYPFADIYTFHAVAGKMFSTTVHTDTLLLEWRNSRVLSTWNGPLYEMLVLDEVQDMTPDLYWLTCSLISVLTRTSGRVPRLVVLGDTRQAIYDFRRADARHLDLAPSIFSDLSPYPWADLPLSVSFRLSRENASFVNNVLLGGEQYVEGSHDGPRPLYVRANLKDITTLSNTLVPLIQMYGAENSAILAPSVRMHPTLPGFTNTLSKHFKLAVSDPLSDNMPLDPVVLHGKLAVSTYHQFKGTERDLVIVYGVDAYYFSKYARHLPDDRCPNALFVALTRARKQLVVIQSDDHRPMPFLPWASLLRHAELVNISPKQLKEQDKPGRPPETCLNLPVFVPVTELIRHVPGELVEALRTKHVELVKRRSSPRDRWHIDAPSRVLTNAEKNHFESVSDLNGLAVTAACEWEMAQSLTTLGYRNKLPAIAETRINAEWLAREAAAYDAKVSGYESRLVQMQDHTFDWLNPFLDDAMNRLRSQLPTSNGLQFEMEFCHPVEVTERGEAEQSVHKTALCGRADIVRGSVIWEIKFVSELTSEHALQAAIYGWLWAVTKRRKRLPKIILFNIRDGAKWEIHSTMEGVDCAVEELLRTKYTPPVEKTTEEFLRGCEAARREVEDVEAGCKRSLGQTVPESRLSRKHTVE